MTDRSQRGTIVHPLWTATATLWTGSGADAELKQDLGRVELPEKDQAVVLAQHFLSRYAHLIEEGDRLLVSVLVAEGHRQKGFRDFGVSAQAVAQGAALGLSGAVAEEIGRMARLSAPLTHPVANRRFKSFIMKIEDDMVRWIGRYEGDHRASRKGRR